MDVYRAISTGRSICGNPYAGRGIVTGKTPDGKKAAVAYFIMGRSENSRNRIFIEKGDSLLTAPFDESRVGDPSLIIYTAIRKCDNCLIVTNGNQTDTIFNYIQRGRGFSEALESREFEPDAPNFTPRISSLLTFENGCFTYKMSILKSADAEGSACNRYTFSYESLSGIGHFIHTYVTDGSPLPSFTGEPVRISVSDDFDEFTNEIWNNLDERNRISLHTRYINIETGKTEMSRTINKNE